MSKKINWGIIGCGNVTEVKSGPAYQKVDGFELVAVMRRNEEKAKDYADRHNVKKYYTDADLLINDDEVDAIYIATPPDSHKKYALKVAEAGKPCCIEKPLAPNYEDCIAITEVFKKKGIPLFTAYYRRSLPRFLKIKEWLEEKYIGEVRHLNWHFSSPPRDIDLTKEYPFECNPLEGMAKIISFFFTFFLSKIFFFETIPTLNPARSNLSLE